MYPGWVYTSVSVMHYSDVIMSAMASQITEVSVVYSTVCSGADQRKHLSSASLVTGEFPAQLASNAENGSIWWRHHGSSAPHLKEILRGMSTIPIFKILTKTVETSAADCCTLYCSDNTYPRIDINYISIRNVGSMSNRCLTEGLCYLRSGPTR